MTLDELAAYLDAQGVARQRVPERLEIVDELPMIPSGKIQKYRLREIVAARLGRPPVR